MARQTPEVTLPNVRLRFEDLLEVIQSLDRSSRARVAQALADSEMDARLSDVIQQLASRACAEDITDAEIDREVQAVRSAARPA
jgi:hypothetical protein